MKVLFVDDEPRVLEGIERAFFCEDDWEVVTATGGKEALELLAQESVDIVVSDMRMPGMDGSAFLQLVYERHPECVRMVLSGQADEAASLRVMNVAHQFLSKPCSPETLKLALGRALLMRAMVDDGALRGLVGRVDQLPVAPAAFRQLTALLERSDPSPREVAAVVARDPALSAKLLQLVNTSFFSRGEPITELLPAVTRLGLRIVRYVALQVGVFRDAKAKELPIDIDALQARCALASEIARALVTARTDQEPAGAAALLAELGVLVFAMFRAQEWLALYTDHDDPRPLPERERATFGCTHAQISAYLLALWGLPDVVARAVLTHNETLPEPAAAIDVATAVALGHRLAAQRELPEQWLKLPSLAARGAEIAAWIEQAKALPSELRGGK